MICLRKSLCRFQSAKAFFKGEKLDLEKYNKMLDQYYLLHKWDTETGWPTKQGLLELNLDMAVEKLEQNRIKLKN